MNLKKLFRVAKRLAPIAVTYGPVVAAAIKEIKKEVKRPKVG
jgi:hypothetical protein